MGHRALNYQAHVVWNGNRGAGTRSYDAYGREFRIEIDGKAALEGSADVAFRGMSDRHNPEELFIAAISSCHMLVYLALCARHDVVVMAYEDLVSATLSIHADGGGRFDRVVLHPRVVLGRDDDITVATSLHEVAHQRCFIAQSCIVPIEVACLVSAIDSHS